MKRRTFCLAAVFGVLFTVVVGSHAWADGVILPDDPEHGWLTIVYHDVSVTIRDGVVTTHVDQLFRNDTGRDLEGRYVFPLPPGAVVSSFTMWVDDAALEARILDADEARAVYEDFVRRAIDPALLEYIGRDTLSARIFPIPAGGERRVEITYSELLAAESGVYRYRYPLDTERFSAWPLERVQISVDLQTSAPLSAVYSPTHQMTVERTSEYAATGVYEDQDLLPSQDFLLYYAVTADELGMTLLTYRSPGEDGYFLLIATPPQVEASGSALPKDLIFVLDRSGSMGSEKKIEQAKEALRFILGNLNPDDRFAVIAFSDYVEAYQTELETVSSDAVARAIAWSSRLDATGGTDIDEALSVAFPLFEQNDRPGFVIFLTDGEATAGEIDPVVIAENALAANAADARVFVFGVGYNVNTVLLDQLAEENRGTTTYVLPGENLEVSLSTFYKKIASPVLADTGLEIAGIETFDVFPRVLPDLFRGSQLVVLGRYRDAGDARVTVSGQVEGVPTAYTTLQSFPDVALESSFLPRLWAGRKIAHLLSQIRLYGESDELVDEVISLSKRHGIITPYTSFLVDENALADEDMADAFRAATAPKTGASAVAGAQMLQGLAQAETVPVQADVERLRVVETRTYYLRDGIWTDNEYDEEETIAIAVYSAAYFDLIGILPWIGPHLALGDRVIIAVGDVFIEIGEEGAENLTPELIETLTP
jgi:Ca-activated chloride channel family protein